MADIQGRTVRLSTFKKWGFEASGIRPRVHEEDGIQTLTEVYCDTCSKYASQIKRDPRLKGLARKEVDRYVDGTTFITKYNLERHLKGLAHKIGEECKKDDIDEVSVPGNESQTSASGSLSLANKQPKIDDALHKAGAEAYKKLLITAYLMAQSGQPLTSFGTLVKCQKANGVKLIKGRDTSIAAGEFVSVIADVVREKLASILCSSNAFSVLSDGSQARKTGQEKELVLIRVAKNGVPAYFCIALQDMDEYGDTNAGNLKKCIDDSFISVDGLNISEDRYKKLMVCATSDGASVNTGKYNGLMVQLKNDERQWLMRIHCVSHRLELAIKDSLLKEKSFSEAKDLMVTLFYLFQNSGKLKRQFLEMAQVLNVTAYSFPKVHGTRFVNHQRLGLMHLLHNWCILIQLFENCISSPGGGYYSIKPKLQGILKKLKNFTFLCTCAFYLHLLENISKLSLSLEKGDIQAFEIPHLLETTTSANEELLHLEPPSFLERLNIHITKSEGDESEISTVTWHLPKKGHNRRLALNKEYVDIVVSRSQLTNVGNIDSHLSNLQQRTIKDVNQCMKDRFASFEDEIFRSMVWLDPANWTNDTAAELNMMKLLADHFAVPLQFAGFSSAGMQKEWPKLKKMVTFFYSGFRAKQLWEKILHYRRQDFPNVSLLVEVLLCIGPSNSIVEKAFSQLTSMLTDQRLCLAPSTMENLLLIKVNHYSWTPSELDEIIEAARAKYMTKRRKLQIESTPFSNLACELVDDQISSNSEESDSESDDNEEEMVED